MHILKWFTLAGEAFPAIPLLGWGTVRIFYLFPAIGMFVLRAIGLVTAIQSGKSKKGNLPGIIASVVSIFPFIGWAMHIATAITLVVDLVKMRK